MIFDALALAALLVFAALGARRGALASGLSLLGIVAGYAAGAAAAWRLAAPAGELLGVPGPLGAAAAGSAAFLATYAAIALVSWLLRRGDDGGSAGRSTLDRIGGAAFGGLRGSLVVLLIGVLALWADAARNMNGDATALAESTPLRSATSAALEAGVEAALGDEAGAAATVAARIVSRPAEAIGGLRGLIEHPSIVELTHDEAFWADVESGAVEFALARPSFRRISGDLALRRELAAFGLVHETAAAEPDLFRREARAALEALGPRLRELRSDPDLQRLASDPRVGAMARQGDVLGLLAHPGFQRVVSRALASGEPG